MTIPRGFARAFGVGAALLPALIVAAIAGVALRRGVSTHVDEAAWVGSAYYFELLARGDFGHPDWTLLPSRESPPVGRYVFGLALRLAGRPIRTIEPLAAWYEQWREVPGTWGSGEDVTERAAVAARLSPEAREAVLRGQSHRGIAPQIRLLRVVAVLFGMACALAIGRIGRACRGPATGLLAGTLFAVHPLAVEAYTHALFDILALTYSTFAVVGLIAVIRPGIGSGRRIAAGVGVGLMTGLAVGTKMNALVVVALSAGLLLASGFSRVVSGSRGLGATCAALAIAPAIAASVFVAINPALHADIPGGLVDSLAIPARTTRVQTGFLPDYLATPGAKLHAVTRLLCGGPSIFAALIAAAGLASAKLRKPLDATAVVAAWWWIGLAAVTAWIPFPWPRYALPILPPAVLLVAILAQDVLTRLRGRSLSRPSAELS